MRFRSFQSARARFAPLFSLKNTINPRDFATGGRQGEKKVRAGEFCPLEFFSCRAYYAERASKVCARDDDGEKTTEFSAEDDGEMGEFCMYKVVLESSAVSTSRKSNKLKIQMIRSGESRGERCGKTFVLWFNLTLISRIIFNALNCEK